MRAVGYARTMRPLEVRALHVGSEEGSAIVRKAWEERRIPVPLEIVQRGGRSVNDAILSSLRALPRSDNEYITVVVPEAVSRSRFGHYLQRRRLLLLKAMLLFERRVAVTDVTLPAEQNLTPRAGAVAPSRILAVVPVSGVHNAAIQALEYARSLSPTDLRAVVINIEPDETERILGDWVDAETEIPLEAIDSPFREVTQTLVRYCKTLRAQRPDAIVNIILPEFVVRRWWHQALHNQTPLAIKAALLFEPGVVVTSIPFHLR
jgi:hypothetical protein